MSFTKLYLTTKTASYTPATIRGTWNDTAGAITRALDTQKVDGGENAVVSRAEAIVSAAYDVLLYRGVSGPLAAQTIAGTLDVILGVSESASTADFAYHVHAYVTQGDSDTPRGTLLSDYIETTANEWPTTTTGKSLVSAQSVSSLAITAGDRLVVEIGFRSYSNIAGSFTGTLRYGTQDTTTLAELADLTAGSTAVTTLAGTLQFSASVTEVDSTERATQFIHEEVNKGTGAAIATQFIHEMVSDNTVSSQRATQFIHEAVSSNRSDRRRIQVSVVT